MTRLLWVFLLGVIFVGCGPDRRQKYGPSWVETVEVRCADGKSWTPTKEFHQWWKYSFSYAPNRYVEEIVVIEQAPCLVEKIQ